MESLTGLSAQAPEWFVDTVWPAVASVSVAATLGVLGFLLSVYNLLRERPRIDVRLGFFMVGTEFHGVHVAIVNVGPQAATIDAILVTSHGERPGAAPLPGTSLWPPIKELEHLLDEAPASNEMLPAVIAAHEAKTWLADADWIKRHLGSDGVLVVRTDWFRPPRFWQRGKRSRTESLARSLDLRAYRNPS